MELEIFTAVRMVWVSELRHCGWLLCGWSCCVFLQLMWAIHSDIWKIYTCTRRGRPLV